MSAPISFAIIINEKRRREKIRPILLVPPFHSLYERSLLERRRGRRGGRGRLVSPVLWDCQGVIHWELLKNGQTVTAEVYIQQLTRVQEQLIKKRPALINFKRVTFLHDNARPHTAKITQEFLDKLGWDVLSHPPYSPDIAPSDYHLFRSLEHFIRNKKYTSKEEVKNALTSFFDSKLRPFYAKGINKLPDRWQKIIDANGNYAFN